MEAVKRRAGSTHDDSRVEVGTSVAKRGVERRDGKGLVFLCSLCTALSYCDRVNLSVAVVDMSKELEWSMSERSAVLSAFFYGYIWSQIPGAFVAQKYGGHIVLGVCAFMWSLCTLVVPQLARSSHHHVMIGRMALGLFEGVVFPTIYHLFSTRVAEEERSQSLASINVGVFSGAIFSFISSPILMHHFGWQSVFYFFGFLGVLWSALWFAFCIFVESRGGNDVPLPCYPSSSPRVSSASTATAVHGFSPVKPSTAGHESVGLLTQARKIIFHKVSFAIFWAHFCHNVGSFVMMSWLPTFFEEAFGLGGSSLALTCLPYIAMSLAVTITSRYADHYIARGEKSLCEVRRFSSIAGFVGAGTFMMLIGTTSWPPVAIAYMCIALACNGAGPVAGYEAAKLDVASPEYVGKFQSISNTLAAFAGIVGVPMVAFVKTRTGSWTSVFLTIGMVFYSAALVFHLFGHYKGRVIV